MTLRNSLFFFVILLLSCGSSPEESPQSTSLGKGEPSTNELLSAEASAGADNQLSQPNKPHQLNHPDTFGIAYLTGRFDPATHPDFTLIEPAFTDREGIYLRKDAYEAFKKMAQAAQEAGIKLVIRSAARNFDYQKSIWEGKWTGARKLSSGENASEAFPDPKDRALKILEWSAMPGASRHHWGTDIDLNAFNNEYFADGEGKKIYDWLTTHAADYGFCQPYTPKGEERPYGYNEEKWHWSYLPVAGPLLREARTYLRDELITGFQGAEAAPQIGVVEKYVLGVSPACR